MTKHKDNCFFWGIAAALSFSSFLVGVEPVVNGSRAVAEWSVLVNMQADNNLVDACEINIQDMEYAFKIGSVDGRVNMLVQIDKPRDKNTWRYKITKGGRIDAGTLIGHEMGYDPVADVVESVQWMKNNFPANHYMLVLSNHGGGVRRLVDMESLLFGEPFKGIFYDDSQSSYLTIPMVGQAISQCKAILGKNLDCLGCDACLMQMAEVCYEVKDCVDFSVASQEVESFYGWPYSKFLIPLLSAPTTSASVLAQSIVQNYDKYYKPIPSEKYYTLSAVRENCMADLKNNIDQVVAAVNVCKKFNATATKSMVKAARASSLKFYDTDFIDLASFYLALYGGAKSIDDFDLRKPTTSPKPRPSSKPKPKPGSTSVVVLSDYQKSLNSLKTLLSVGIQKINTAVSFNVTGSANSRAKGISIYFPTKNPFNGYSQLAFAKQGLWLKFIQDYK